MATKDRGLLSSLNPFHKKDKKNEVDTDINANVNVTNDNDHDIDVNVPIGNTNIVINAPINAPHIPGLTPPAPPAPAPAQPAPAAPAPAQPAPAKPAAPAPAKPAAPAPAKPAAPAPAKPAAPAPAKPAAPAPAKPAAPAPGKPAAPAPAKPATPAKPAAPAPAHPAPAHAPAHPAPAHSSAGVELVSRVEESWESQGCKFSKYAVTICNKTGAAVSDIELELSDIAGLEERWECVVIRVGQGLPALLGLPDHLKRSGGLGSGASHTIGFNVKKNNGVEPKFAVKATGGCSPPATGGGLQLSPHVQKTWESNGCQFAEYSVVVANKTSAAVWDIELELGDIAGLDNHWECTVIRVGQGLPALLGLPDNVKRSGLGVGASHTLGFIVKKNHGCEPKMSVKAR